MPVIEFEPGHQFPGVIGRTADESSPAWPAPKRAPKGTPNVLFIVLDDTGFGQLGCFGSPIDTPNLDALAAERPALQQHAHDRAVLAEPVVHHHRSKPSQQRDVRRHRVRHRFPWLQRQRAVRERLLVGDPARAGLQHVHAREVASHPEQPGVRGGAVRPLAAWPGLRTLLRVPRRRHQPVAPGTWCTTTIRSSRPRPPEEGYHLTPDLADKAMQFIADAKQIDPDKPFYLHFCPGATHAPHHVPKEWADKYAGKFNDGWDAYRTRTFARQKELGIVPANCELSRHDPDVPEWDSLSDDQRRLYAREMEIFAGLPQPHRPPHRSPHRVPAHDRPARQHVDHGRLRQRRERRGRRDRHHQRGAVLQQLPGAFRGQPEGRSTSSAGRSTSITTRGAGPSPETRRSVAGSGRRTGVARATRSSCTGRPVSRPTARCARSMRTSSTWCPPCWTRSGSNRPRQSRVSRSRRSKA